MNYKIIRLTDNPALKEQAAQWFHEKWHIPLAAYLESMTDCLTGKAPVPQWYMAIEDNRIIGGLGVIENDFHNRKDLTPNVCAVYTEKDKRCNGVAGALLNFVCADMKEKGIDTLYLVTDHASFYERYGWEFLCMAQGDGEPEMSRMYYHKEGEIKMEPIWKEMYQAAKAVQNGRKISDYVDAGGVAAAVLSSSGNIYTGVCIDTCSTLGICAERNAIFHMITNGEQEMKKVLAIMPNGKTGAPCGACRELMVQLMPDTYQEIEILLDYEAEKIVTLGELTPEWWI